MIIIGKTAHGFLLEAERNEVANLIGYGWSKEQGCPQLEVGTTVRVVEMYEQLHLLSRAHASLKTICESLRGLADTLSIVIDPLTVHFELPSSQAKARTTA